MELCRQEPWLLAASMVLNQTSSAAPGEQLLDEFRDRRRAWEEEFIRRGQSLGAVRTDFPPDLLVAISLGARQAANLWMLERFERVEAEESDGIALQVMHLYRTLLSPPDTAGSAGTVS